jgi:hypothetical protein
MAVRMPERRWYDRPRVREFAFQIVVNVTSALLTVMILYLGAIATGIIRDQPDLAIRVAQVVVALVSFVVAAVLGVSLRVGKRAKSPRDHENQGRTEE